MMQYRVHGDYNSIFLQSTREQLERENQQLFTRVKESASQNALIVAEYESRLEVSLIIYSS